jgi:hypothetical protein
MANNLSDVAENRALDWLNPAQAAPTRPTSPLKIALYTTAPNQETGAGGTEVSGGSYARTNVTLGAASGGSASNTADVTFPTATASWGTVVAAAIFDDAGTPVMLWSGTLAASKTIDSGDVFKFLTGQVTVSLN